VNDIPGIRAQSGQDQRSITHAVRCLSRAQLHEASRKTFTPKGGDEG
jgi:hypothetical protein